MSSIISSFDGEYYWLSNFCTSLLEFEGLRYTTVEHAYQAAKTLDAKEREDIRTTFSPGGARHLGKRCTIRPDWEAIKVEVMLGFLRMKFADPGFADLLRRTGDAVLVEGNTWHDQFWGDCVCPRHVNVAGKNMLGRLLMQLREELR